jgi:hypothetical protein
MPPKKVRLAGISSTNVSIIDIACFDLFSFSSNILQTTTIISDLWRSHRFLAPNEYSSSTIGIHSCLVRCCESEHFARCFYQETIIGLNTK